MTTNEVMPEEQSAAQGAQSALGEEGETPLRQMTAEEEKLVAEVNAKYRKWHEDREPNEVTWFINTAMDRGLHFLAWDNRHHTLRETEPPLPPHKRKTAINLIFPKLRARLAKFLRARPIPQVIPGSTELKDKLNARASQLALHFAWRKFGIETKYRDALLWAKTCSKGFWWFNWNEDAFARVQLSSGLGEKTTVDLPIGDIEIEVGSPFEVLIPDPSISWIGDQPEIMRAKMRDLEEMRARYPEFAHLIQPTPGMEEAFRYEQRIAHLSAKAEGMTENENQTGSDPEGGNTNRVLVKELFTRPGGKNPQGRYLVVVGDVLTRQEQELPFFGDMLNPYPVEEFVDVPTVGQFWPTTIVEQLTGPQRQYNFIRNKIDQQLRLMMHPKIFIPAQAMIAKTAFHSGAGEKITYNWIPGLPPPFPWTPPNVAADAWRLITTLREEIDAISQIFPAAEGAVGDAKSGIQTNLLQEASDSVHAPDARAHELALERAAWKIRRLMKIGYDIPRLLTVTGRHKQPEVFEFFAEQIDEHADIVIQTGSGLPYLKAARQQILIEWYDKGIFGPIGDPETNRKFLSVAEVPGLDDVTDPVRTDEELAQKENDDVVAGMEIPVPQFYENHLLHYQVHSNELKSTASRQWDDETRLALIRHLLLHFKYINAAAAAQIALEYGLVDMIGFGVDRIPPPAPPLLPAEGGEEPGGGNRPPPGKPGSGEAPPEAPPPPMEASQPQTLTAVTQ